MNVDTRTGVYDSAMFFHVLSESFCYHLLNRYHVALVPGSAFGADPCVRISYASGQKELTRACEQMLACCLSLKAPTGKP